MDGRQCAGAGLVSGLRADSQSDVQADVGLGPRHRTQLCPHGHQARLGNPPDRVRGWPGSCCLYRAGDRTPLRRSGAFPRGATRTHGTQGVAGRADVGPLRHAAAHHRHLAFARLRGLCHRLAQRPRHPRQLRQVRHRGLHPVSGRFHPPPGSGCERDRRLPARTAFTGRDRHPGRRGSKVAAQVADPDRRPDRPRCGAHRSHRFRQPHHHAASWIT